MKEKCGDCKFYLKSESVSGLCRRYPPLENGCPMVGSDWWCGEWDDGLIVETYEKMDNGRY